MPWNCPICGTQNDAYTDVCAAHCGHVRVTRLVLVSQSTHREQALMISADIAKDTLKRIADDESKYASSPQFHLHRDKEGTCWYVEHATSATHPTFLNGAQLSPGRHPLKSGDVLCVGGKRLFLTVRLERLD